MIEAIPRVAGHAWSLHGFATIIKTKYLCYFYVLFIKKNWFKEGCILFVW
jgi:hypothetical protein